MKTLLLMAFIAAVATSFVVAQTRPNLGTLTAGGVQSRNMELVDIIPFRPGSGDQFDVTTVPYVSGGISKKKQLLVTVHNETGGTNVIRIVDVTNPRQPNESYIRISLQDFDDEDEGTRQNFERIAIYTDVHEPSSETFNGDVLLVVWVDDLIYDEFNNQARFVIINLTKAVALRETGTTDLIEIYNAGVRNVKYNGSILSPANRDVYIGYIPSDGTFHVHEPHTLGYDQKSGILVLPTIEPTNYGGTDYVYTDMFDLKEIVTKCVKGSSTLGVLERITMSGGAPVTIPLVSSARLCPHDIVPHYISDNKVR